MAAPQKFLSGNPPTTPPKTPQGRNRVRIIGGAWRSRMLEFPDAQGLRPTADRVRETLFNWLGQTLTDYRCLDLFAGSGALGFEAASRGAEWVVMVENNRIAIEILKKNQALLTSVQCEIVQADALSFIKNTPQIFNIIFVDPPFASDFLPEVLPKLTRCLAANGLVYAEWHRPLAEVIAGTEWTIVREGRAGRAFFALLSAKAIPTEAKP